MEWSPICEKDVAEELRTTLNWKANGREQIPNFWLKQLTATHKHIAAIFNKLIKEDSITERLTAGVKYLISIPNVPFIKHSHGCKEQLIIYSVYLEQAHGENRNQYIAYIDYRNALH
jgi:hypothetical protein